MAKRHNHYEAAFEAYLRRRRIAYVAVDERRRALEAEGSLKSVDFIVSPLHGARWLVDVKGRKFPSGRQYWRNWTTREELTSLARWSDHFGEEFLGVLVFAYQLTADRSPTPPADIFVYRGAPYAFIVISASQYQAIARPLSARWETVSVPTNEFRRIGKPLSSVLTTNDEYPDLSYELIDNQPLTQE